MVQAVMCASAALSAVTASLNQWHDYGGTACDTLEIMNGRRGNCLSRHHNFCCLGLTCYEMTIDISSACHHSNFKQGSIGIVVSFQRKLLTVTEVLDSWFPQGAFVITGCKETPLCFAKCKVGTPFLASYNSHTASHTTGTCVTAETIFRMHNELY